MFPSISVYQAVAMEYGNRETELKQPHLPILIIIQNLRVIATLNIIFDFHCINFRHAGRPLNRFRNWLYIF